MPTSGRRHTILIVDDDPNVIQSVSELLRQEHAVLGATGGDDGLRVLDEQPVDVVMSDQRMPSISGVDFLRQVRERHPDVTRLLVTAYADVRTVIDAINQGHVYRYIAKPWDPDDLRGVIREACERHDLVVDRRRLLDELQTKNADLERANAELQRVSDLKTSFIRVAGHELRTPLALQLGLLGLARRADVAPPVRDLLSRAERAAQRLSRRVEQLMELLYADRFARPLDRQPTDLGALARDAADDVRPFVDLRNQTLRVDVGDDVGSLDVDGPKLEDSLNQLLLNAIKFTPDGGEVSLAVSRAEGAVRIAVSDTGVGIEPELLPHVFEPFFTGLDAAHHSSGHFEFGARGLGLGLSVVKTFVALHGGRVGVRSEPGRGTTITIELPERA